MPRLWRAWLGALVIAVAVPAVAMANVSTTGVPTITGTAKVGSTLTCHGPTWTSNDGGTPTPEDYLWYYSTAESHAISESFSGSQNTYAVQAADVGKQIVCVQAEEDGGSGNFHISKSGFSDPTLAVAAGAPPTTTGKTTIEGTGQVGSFLECQGPTWTPSGGGFDFVDTSDSWYYSTNTTTPLPNGSDTSSYTVQPADANKQIVCIQTATDADTAGTATSKSDPLPIAPEAAVTLTQYSPVVSGNTGENVGAVTVTLTLERFAGSKVPPVAVATATTTTSAAGAWKATLAPKVAGPGDALAVSGDQLVIQYSGGPSGTILPHDTSYGTDVDFAGPATTISADGKTVQSDTSPCASLKIIVDGTANSTTGSFPCTFKPATALTDNNHVQAQRTGTYSDTNDVDSALTTVSDVGLLGVGLSAGDGEGAPTCSADLVSGEVICDGLNGGTFTASNGTSSGNLSIVKHTTSTGWVEDEGTGFLTGIAPGQKITLKEGASGRTLTTLNVATLRVDYNLAGGLSGSCQPNKMFGSGGETALCPVGGTFTTATGGDSSLFDDLSGGRTVVNVPTIGNRIPSALDSIAGGAFTAYGDLGNVGSTAQVLAQTKSVALAIVPHAGGSPVFRVTMTPSSDALGPFVFGNVTGLTLGRYFADYALTDSHGDTRPYSDEFAVQPASAGPAGTPGAQGLPGAPGAAGKDGSSSEVKCTSKKTGKGKHKKTKTTCTVSVLAPGSHTISVALSRGRTTFAAATAVVRAGVARIKLRHNGALRHGRYLVTVVASGGGKTTVARRYERL